MNFGLPLVGRDAELARLRACVEAVAAGQGALVLLGGEAGVGKSALLAAAMQEAEQPLVLPCRCPGPGETPPFGPWLEALHLLQLRTGCDLAVLPPPFGTAPARTSSYELAGVIAGWIHQQGRPLLVAIEDLHWADPGTLELLRHLAGRLQTLPLLVIATYRSEELTQEHPLWPLLPELQRAGGQRLLLPRLSSAAVNELVRTALGPAPAASPLGELLYRRTGGLALFVHELLEAAARTGQVPREGDPLPETVQQALDSKLVRLPGAAHEVLAAAAVIGEQFDYQLLAQVVELSEDELVTALEEAIGLHLIRPEGSMGDRFAFAHALVRELLLSRLIGLRRRRWHARVAAALGAVAQPDVDALALHLSRAGDPRAGESLLAAGDRALRLGAPVQAAQRYEEALTFLSTADPRRGELLLRLGWCLRYADPQRAIDCCQEATAAAQATGSSPSPEKPRIRKPDSTLFVFGSDSPLQVWAWHVATDLNKRSSRLDLQYLEQVKALQAAQAELLDDPRYQELEALLYGKPCGYPRIGPHAAIIHMIRGELDEAGRLLDQLQASAPNSYTSELALAQRYLALFAGRLDDAVQICRRGIAAALAEKNYSGALAHLWDCLHFLMMGRADPDEADAIAAEAISLESEALRVWGYGLVPAGYSMVGLYQYLRGDWPAAWHNLIELAHHHADPVMIWAAVSVLWESGDLTGAFRLAERMQPLQPDDPAPFSVVQVWTHALRAHMHLDLGEPEQALRWLEAAERWPAAQTSALHRPVLRLAWAAYHRKTGDLTAAWAAARVGLAGAEAVPLIWWVMRGRRWVGELAAELGDTEAAAAHFARAIDMAERCRIPFEAALTRLSRVRACPDSPGRRADLQAARAGFAALGAAPMLAEADALLAAAPPAADLPPPPTRSGRRADGLTERELEVAALVARGHTDREVAAELFLSRRTVDRHLRNIFGKLGVSNRAALAAWAARQGLERP